MASTYIYQQEWRTKLEDRLDKPQNWKDVCDVIYTDQPAIVFTQVTASDEPAVTTGLFTATANRDTLSNVIAFSSVTQTTQTMSIITTDYDNVYIDYATQAQSNFGKVMDHAGLLADKIGERVETIVLANHAAWTNMGDDGAGNPALASAQFTVTESNIDNLIRQIIEEIQTANGYKMYLQKGGFVVWRPKDNTKLVTFMQANGFSFADEALRDGGKGRMGKETMGLFHYVSTSHAANHLMAGIRGVQKLGLLNATFGKPYFVEHPASSTAGFLSGTSVYHRLDYGHLVLTVQLPVIYDINVAT